ncbi:MAG: HNH endonuclease [Xanthobacter sp.]
MCPCERARKAAADKRRPGARTRGYDSKWDTERAAFLKVNPKCRRCNATADVVDHIEPHRGNARVFWNRSNWQSLCKTCHSSWKQSQEKKHAC